MPLVKRSFFGIWPVVGADSHWDPWNKATTLEGPCRVFGVLTVDGCKFTFKGLRVKPSVSFMQCVGFLAAMGLPKSPYNRVAVADGSSLLKVWVVWESKSLTRLGPEA